MNWVSIDQYRQIDVHFSLLNDLTARLQASGARITVRKLGKLHRITLIQEPKIASVEEILSYAIRGDKTQAIEVDQVTNAIESLLENDKLPIDETLVQHQNLPELVALDDLKKLSVEKLKEFAALYKIAGRSKMQPEKLATKLHGLITKEQLL